ncbi:MAG: alpha/beta hydrolase [Gammaproteobacteria bacterium]|nr:alpha/beta hydrolase [Gammaproteobacteria bacterium]
MTTSPRVVLVNGLWLTNIALGRLARRLASAGFAPRRFSYRSVRNDLRANAAALQSLLDTLPDESIHFVAYSLGGLVLRALFHFYPEQRPGRIVLIGSPQQDNAAARNMIRSRLGRRLLGASIADLVAGRPQDWEWPAREIGVIAGNRSLGLGRLVSPLPVPNDGTVTVEETTVAGASGRLILPVWHSGLLMSAEVASATSQFLHTGRFPDPGN